MTDPDPTGPKDAAVLSYLKSRGGDHGIIPSDDHERGIRAFVVQHPDRRLRLEVSNEWLDDHGADEIEPLLDRYRVLDQLEVDGEFLVTNQTCPS